VNAGEKKQLSLEVLVSCMHEEGEDIIKRSRITTDVLVVNQCDCEEKFQKFDGIRRIIRINTAERGLSRSRNMAIENAKDDICLLCDDDEMFVETYSEIIREAFSQIPEADIIVFCISNQPCKLKKEAHRLSKMQCLHVSSWQIAFRRKSVVECGVRFDVYMGAGSGNGGGEEIKFLLDCYDKGLRIYHVPEVIASVSQEKSTWFQGYDSKFFYQRGISTRYMLGLVPATAYAFYYVIRKRALYKNDISMYGALKAILSGIKNNDIQKMKQG
jgi:glycosyltransferase involved in cell wall biosynthesis